MSQQAQDLLIANNLQGAWVSDVVRSSLNPFLANKGSLQLHGPALSLKNDAVHALSLILHELATNALKYGALTRPQGKVVVSWDLDGANHETSRFLMSWHEVDGPPVLPPQRMGFGSEVTTEMPNTNSVPRSLSTIRRRVCGGSSMCRRFGLSNRWCPPERVKAALF